MSNVVKSVYKRISKTVVKRRLKHMEKLRRLAMENVNVLHVKILQGKSDGKLGSNVWHLSLMAVFDCINHDICMWDCYDIKNVMIPRIRERVIKCRAINSAIHKLDTVRFWKEAQLQIEANYITFLRINMGGDLTDEDFFYLADLAKNVSQCDIMLFTKNYKGINEYLNVAELPSNVHVIMSCWENVDFDNPYHLPVSHILYPDGRTTAPDYGAIYCGKNCTACSYAKRGCWTLKEGDNLILHAH